MKHTNPSASVDNQLTTDQQAIICLKQGDLAGLTLLVQNYQVKAVHAALFIVHDRDLAEEIVQEAFLQAYRKIGQFDERRPFGAWFLRIVINDALKAAGRQQRFAPIEEAEDGYHISEWLIDARPGPEEMAQTAEMHESLWKALEQLTPNQRKAVVLRYFLEKDESEMIRELNRPLTTVKWWLHSARQRLKKLLSPIEVSESETREVEHE
jgi:RNA polymerase sigma-70 factor (ECF subfamily)